MRFEGIFTPVAVPCLADFSLHTAGFAQVLEYLEAAGVSGIIVGGTTGESYAHTSAERVACFRQARDVLGGRVPLVAGVGALRTEDAIELANEARNLKYDGLLVASPPYALPSEAENADHALAIDAAAAGVPIMLYNYPGRTGVGMGRDYLSRITKSPNFTAIKESSGDVYRIHLLVQEFPQLALSVGTDDLALEFFAWGARSWVGAASNFAPKAHLALWQACVEDGDFERGRALMRALLPLLEHLEQSGHFLASIKACMRLRGLPAGPPRLPLRALDGAAEASLGEVVRKMDADLAKLGVEA